MFDLLEEIAAIHRTVARDDGARTVTLEVSRRYDADVDDVWAALTDPDRIRRWFYPISGDLRPGGTFQLEGNAGGDIHRCEPPSLLTVTFGSPDSVVDLHLAPADDRTTVRLVHTVPLALAQSVAGALFVGPGWDGALLALGLHLRGQSPADPLAAAGSPEVVEFNRGSVDRWTVAVEAAGSASAEEVAGAREMALATYTVTS